MLFRKKIPVGAALVTGMVASLANAQSHMEQSRLSYAQRALSTQGNAADAALVIERKDPHVVVGGMINTGFNLEYGDFDELFEAYDELSEKFEPLDPNEPPTAVQPIEPPPEDEEGNVDWDNIFETYPELEDRLAIIKKEVVATAALLTTIAVEGYAKADINLESTFVLHEDLWGGTLMMGASSTGFSNAIGIMEPIDFDEEQVKSQLRLLPDLTEEDDLQALDLSGGVTLYYEPSTKKAKVTVDNDSLLLVKAAVVNKFLFMYSQKAFKNKHGSLYWGVKPTYYQVGLSNVAVRLGDLTDAEALFNDIKDAELEYESAFDFDLGLTWAAENYQVGASLNNVIESSYEFPGIERRRFTSLDIINKLDYHEHFTFERQLTIDGAMYTADRKWNINAALDANAIVDPMKNEYQWFNVSGGYSSGNWWLPSARVGFSKNFAGSELSYLNAGVTMFKYVNFDISTTLDKVDLEGTELPRGFNVGLGVQFAY